MAIKPSDLLFGLMDFLAFIVPGFVLCVTLPDYVCWKIPTLHLGDQGNSAFLWCLVFVISYILGHFLHHISAMLLNPIYDKTYLTYKSRKHSAFIILAENSIRRKLPFHNNYLKLAEAYLKVSHPSLIPDLEKHEANSKLFRSLCILSIYLCFHPCMQWPLIVVLIGTSLLSFTKFANQRWTHRFLIYQYFLIPTGDAPIPRHSA